MFSNKQLLCAATSAVILSASSAALAADGNWIHNGNGNWSDASRWDSSAIADGIDSTAFFTTEFTGNRTVTLDSARTIGNIVYTDTTPSHNLTLTLPNTLTLDVTSGSSTIDVSQAGRTLTLNHSVDGSTLAGSSGLTKTGDGKLILKARNNTAYTYSGQTLVSGGVMQYGTAYQTTWNAESFSANTNLEVNGGIISGWWNLQKTLGTGNGEVQFTGGSSGIAFLQSDRSLLQFGGSAAYEVVWGSATFNPGELILNDTAASTNNVIDWQNKHDFNGADRTIATNSAALVGRSNQAFVRILGGGAVLRGDIQNSNGGSTAGLIKNGVGKLGLTATNTYDGGTTVNAGGIFFDRLVSMPATGNVTLADGGEIIVTVGEGGAWTTGTSGVGTLGGLLNGDGGQTASQVVYNGAATVGVNVTTNSNTYAGDISDVNASATSLSVYADDGSGSLELTGNNTYTGNTTINSGATLIANSANALSSGLISFGGNASFGGSTLRYTAVTAGIDYSSRIRNSTNAIGIDTNGQNVTFAGVMDNTNIGGLTKTGAGTLTITGANSFGGGTISVTGGTLDISSGSLNNRPLFIESNGTVVANGIVALGTGTITNRGTLHILQDGGGTITNGFTSTGRDRPNTTYIFDRATPGAADNWTINVPNSTNNEFNAARGTTITFQKGANVTSGTSTINITDGLHSSESINTAAIGYVADGVILRINGHSNTRGRIFTFSANTEGNEIYGKLDESNTSRVLNANFDGTGSWNITSTNSDYTGYTRVLGGTLLVDGEIYTAAATTANSALTVDAGAFFGGSGTIGAAATIDGTHTPGSSPGIQTFVSDLTYNAGAAVNWELTDDTTTNAANPNAIFDSVVVGGNLDFAGATALNLIFNVDSAVDWTDAFWDSSYTGTNGWLLYDVAGTTSNFGNLSITVENWQDSTGAFFDSELAGSSFSLVQDGQDVYLEYNAVIPEPSSLALLGLGGLLIARRRRH